MPVIDFFGVQENGNIFERFRGPGRCADHSRHHPESVQDRRTGETLNRYPRPAEKQIILLFI